MKRGKERIELCKSLKVLGIFHSRQSNYQFPELSGHGYISTRFIDFPSTSKTLKW
jgi:hypothetical protein